jgi:DNA-binding Lrp family transcriptional regulator
MINPEFSEKLSLVDSAKIERLQELEEAALIISYQANLNGVDLDLETNSERAYDVDQDLSQEFIAA